MLFERVGTCGGWVSVFCLLCGLSQCFSGVLDRGNVCWGDGRILIGIVQGGEWCVVGVGEEFGVCRFEIVRVEKFGQV